MEVEIKKYDHKGRGLGYLNNKIVFVPYGIIGDTVDIEIEKETSKYLLGRIQNYKNKSKCPYYGECGGCHLRHMKYDDTINFKEDKVKSILKKYVGIDIPIQVIKSTKDFYRNKVEFKIENGIVGFYQNNTHNIVQVDRCLNAEDAINSLLLNISSLNVINGEITVRTNYNSEIIINIKSNDKPNIDIEKLRSKNKLVGIVYNDEVIFGVNHFIEIVDNFLFKVTYNSFFQVNRCINTELFKIVKNNIKENSTILDLCCGVGTLSIVASTKAKKVYGIEIVENAIKDALINAKMNKRDNINFILGDAFTSINKIQDNIDTLIIDPPRSGLKKETIKSIIDLKPNDIIYISCDPLTLSRDLNYLKEIYKTKEFYLLDMFSYTYHCESVAILKIR